MRTPILKLTLAAALACSFAGCKKKDAATDAPKDAPKDAPAAPATPPAADPAATAPATPPTADPAATAGGKSAEAKLESRSGSSVTGTVTLTAGADGKVNVDVKVAGLAPGDHGFHIHQTGDCSAPDAKSAGDHFNPDAVDHGAPEAMPHHAGDFGNLTAGADGNAAKTFSVDFITLDDGPKTAIGKAFIVHEKADDLKTQPSGNAGARVACGVVAAK